MRAFPYRLFVRLCLVRLNENGEIRPVAPVMVTVPTIATTVVIGAITVTVPLIAAAIAAKKLDIIAKTLCEADTMTLTQKTIAALLFALFLAGCGQSGPLYIPGEPTATEPPAERADSDAPARPNYLSDIF